MKQTLNLGCGERTYKEYPEGYKCINYDERSNLPNVDVVGDVRELPFEDNYFDYILASDIVEHFPIKQNDALITEWCRVLKPGGTIEFRTPNLKKICWAYVNGHHDTKFTSWLLYGGQGYSGNFHYVGFDRDWLRKRLGRHKLVEVGYREDGNNFIMIVRKNA